MFRDNAFVQENSETYVNKHAIRFYSVVYINDPETPWRILRHSSGIQIFCVMPQFSSISFRLRQRYEFQDISGCV